MANQRNYPRAARLNTQLRGELVALLRSNIIRDPRVSGVDITVTGVDVTPDMSHAHIWVSTLGDDAQLAAAIQGLNHAAGKFRHELGLRLHIRYVPTLRFVADEGTRTGDRIGALLRNVVAEDRKHAVERGEDPDKS